MKATAEQDGNELVTFLGLSAVCRLSAKSLRLTGLRTHGLLSQREHSPYEIGRTKRSTCDPQHFSGPSECLSSLTVNVRGLIGAVK